MARIFISYRREESSASAGRLHDQLLEHFGRDNVFMDVDTIEPGLDFTEVIERTVALCDVLIALIGRQWLVLTEADGQRRLDNPEDFVRREIATALQRNIRVIPALIQGMPMPRATQLPEDLQPLARRNALELSDMHFHRDVDALIEVLDRVLGIPPSPASPAGTGDTAMPLSSPQPTPQEIAQEEVFAKRFMRYITNHPMLIGTSILAVMIIGGVFISDRIPLITLPTKLLRWEGPMPPTPLPGTNVSWATSSVEKMLSLSQGKAVQEALCIEADGDSGDKTREAIGLYYAAKDRPNVRTLQTDGDASALLVAGTCKGRPIVTRTSGSNFGVLIR